MKKTKVLLRHEAFNKRGEFAYGASLLDILDWACEQDGAHFNPIREAIVNNTGGTDNSTGAEGEGDEYHL